MVPIRKSSPVLPIQLLNLFEALRSPGSGTNPRQRRPYIHERQDDTLLTDLPNGEALVHTSHIPAQSSPKIGDTTHSLSVLNSIPSTPVLCSLIMSPMYSATAVEMNA